jgi:anti-anti-sigma regulatory factor
VQLHVSLALMTGRHGGARAVVVAAGEIDLATVGPLRAAARAVAAAAHPRPDHPVPLVLDWERVVFLDSSGVHFLQDMHAEGLTEGWALQLRPPSAAAPVRLLRLAADHGWLPRQLAQQLPSQWRRVRSSHAVEA